MKIFMAQELADRRVKRQAKCARISIAYYDTPKSKERQSKSSKFSRDLMVLIKSVAKQDIIYFKIEDIELSRALARAQQEKDPQEPVVFLLVAHICISRSRTSSFQGPRRGCSKMKNLKSM
jgi:hypothetical protein